MSARLARQLSSRSAHAFHRRRHRLRGGAESLEDRSLLSVTPQELAVALTHSAEHYANVVQADGSTIFPSTAIKRFDTPAGVIPSLLIAPSARLLRPPRLA